MTYVDTGSIHRLDSLSRKLLDRNRIRTHSVFPHKSKFRPKFLHVFAGYGFSPYHNGIGNGPPFRSSAIVKRNKVEERIGVVYNRLLQVITRDNDRLVGSGHVGMVICSTCQAIHIWRLDAAFKAARMGFSRSACWVRNLCYCGMLPTRNPIYLHIVCMLIWPIGPRTPSRDV